MGCCKCLKYFGLVLRLKEDGFNVIVLVGICCGIAIIKWTFLGKNESFIGDDIGVEAYRIFVLLVGITGDRWESW